MYVYAGKHTGQCSRKAAFRVREEIWFPIWKNTAAIIAAIQQFYLFYVFPLPRLLAEYFGRLSPVSSFSKPKFSLKGSLTLPGEGGLARPFPAGRRQPALPLPAGRRDGCAGGGLTPAPGCRPAQRSQPHLQTESSKAARRARRAGNGETLFLQLRFAPAGGRPGSKASPRGLRWRWRHVSRARHAVRSRLQVTCSS